MVLSVSYMISVSILSSKLAFSARLLWRGAWPCWGDYWTLIFRPYTLYCEHCRFCRFLYFSAHVSQNPIMPSTSAPCGKDVVISISSFQATQNWRILFPSFVFNGDNETHCQALQHEACRRKIPLSLILSSRIKTGIHNKGVERIYRWVLFLFCLILFQEFRRRNLRELCRSTGARFPSDNFDGCCESGSTDKQ